MNNDFSEIEKLLTPGAVNSQVKHWYLQFYLSFYGNKSIFFSFFPERNINFLEQNRRCSKTMETTSRRV